MLSDRDDFRSPDHPVLDALLYHAGDAVIALDSNQNLLYCNQLAHALFHIDPQAAIEHLPVRQAVDNPELIDVLCRRVAGESHFRSEIHLAEQAITLNIQITDLDTVGRLAVMQDITYLKELDRVKSEFVERVSRDIRSPLTTILGYVELLDRTGEMNDSQRKFIERIIFGVQSITALLSDLLDLSRIEADFKADQEPTQLTMIVRYAVEGNRQHFEACQQTLTSEIPDRLPLVLGNPLRLRQMVDHLLDNANKYTPPGGSVQVKLDQQGDFLVLTVQDDGMGIPAPDQAHVFEQFFRGSNVKEAGHKGSGLGLTIVKTIVDKHNGRVWLDSSEGAGTAFTVMLPTTLIRSQTVPRRLRLSQPRGVLRLVVLQVFPGLILRHHHSLFTYQRAVLLKRLLEGVLALPAQGAQLGAVSGIAPSCRADPPRGADNLSGLSRAFSSIRTTSMLCCSFSPATL